MSRENELRQQVILAAKRLADGWVSDTQAADLMSAFSDYYGHQSTFGPIPDRKVYDKVWMKFEDLEKLLKR